MAHFPQRISSAAAALLACSLDQPLQHGVKIGLLFRADTIAAYLAVGNLLKVQRIDELIYRKLFRKIRLISED